MLVAIAMQVGASHQAMDAQSVTFALFGLHGLPWSVEIQSLVRVLVPKIEACTEPLHEQQRQFAVSGLRLLEGSEAAQQLRCALATIPQCDVPSVTLAGPLSELCPLAPGKHELRVQDIGFSQESCGVRFRDGRPVLDTASELLHDAKLLSAIPAIEVVYHRGRFFTLDNRRLVAFRLVDLARKIRGIPTELPLPVRIPVEIVGRERAVYRQWDRKFHTGLWAGRSILIERTSGLRVGSSAATTTFGIDLLRL
jgi:hypothetical protein